MAASDLGKCAANTCRADATARLVKGEITLTLCARHAWTYQHQFDYVPAPALSVTDGDGE